MSLLLDRHQVWEKYLAVLLAACRHSSRRNAHAAAHGRGYGSRDRCLVESHAQNSLLEQLPSRWLAAFDLQRCRTWRIRAASDRYLVTSSCAKPPEVHALGCFVPGALPALHLLGVVCNHRRRNGLDVAAHLAATLYDARSARYHYRMEQIALRG